MTFEEYVLTRGPALVRLARLLAGDDHREDLAQDVLATAYVRWDRICRADHPDRYLRRMLVNARNSWWRRLANREVAVAAVTETLAPADFGGDSADRDAMWRLVASLPPRQPGPGPAPTGRPGGPVDLAGRPDRLTPPRADLAVVGVDKTGEGRERWHHNCKITESGRFPRRRMRAPRRAPYPW